jgi:AraC family transcriptional regulator, transcriptional activator of pobA
MVLLEHMRNSPVFQLFGETTSQTLQDGMHLESIAERSKLYDWEISSHRHDSLLQILHVRSGVGEVMLEERRQAILAPSVTIVPPGIEHGFRFHKNVQGSVLSFSEHKLTKLLSFDPALLHSFGTTHHATLPNSQGEAESLSGQIRQLQSEFGHTNNWRDQQLQALSIGIFISLARALHLHSGASFPATRAQTHLRAFRALVDAHFREHLPVQEYAKRLGITSNQLNRVCNAITERPALELIQERCMTEACRDLTFSVLSIKQIAFALGFEDESYFSRVFRRRLQRTPLDYRRAMQASMRSGRLGP